MLNELRLMEEHTKFNSTLLPCPGNFELLCKALCYLEKLLNLHNSKARISQKFKFILEAPLISAVKIV